MVKAVTENQCETTLKVRTKTNPKSRAVNIGWQRIYDSARFAGRNTKNGFPVQLSLKQGPSTLGRSSIDIV